jgi:hypothetical protein
MTRVSGREAVLVIGRVRVALIIADLTDIYTKAEDSYMNSPKRFGRGAA